MAPCGFSRCVSNPPSTAPDMQNRHLIAFVFPFLVSWFAPNAAAYQKGDDLRQRLAQSGSEWIGLEARRTAGRLSDDERDRRMELEEDILETAGVVLGKAAHQLSEEAIEGALAEALAEHDPDAASLFEAMLRERDHAPAAEGRLQSIEAALVLYQIANGQYPPTSTGLVALIGEDLIHASDLLDPWQHPMRYEVTNDGADFRVTSIGADGVEGTGDDLWVDGSGEIVRTTPGGAAAPANPAQPMGLGSVPAADGIVTIELTGDGLGIAYIAQRADGFWGGWGHGESGPFDALQLVTCGDVAGACAFVGTRDSVLHLITPTGTRALPNLKAVGFVNGTTDLYLLEQENGHHRGTIAGRELAFGLDLKPGQASVPTFDSDGHAVAWRERLADGRYIVHIGPKVSEPAEWASSPVVLPLAGGDLVAFRMWDGEKTMAVVGTDGFSVAWARNPVVSPGGTSWGMAVALDGEPADNFEEAREQQCAEHRSNGYSVTPAFVTSQANVIVNGKIAGGDSAWAGDPVFAEDGSRWAYPIRDEGGQWHIHRGSPGAVTSGPGFDEVARPRIVLGGRHVLHSARRDGVDMLVCDSVMNAASWGVRVLTGADGYAWVDDDEGQRILVTATADFSDIASVARADEIDLRGFLPGTTQPIARLRDGEKWRLYVDGVGTDWGGRVLPPAASRAYVGHGIEVGDEYVPAVYDVAEKRLRRITPDHDRAGFDAIGRPHVGETGAIAFEVATDAYVFTLLPDDYPVPTGGGSKFLVFQDGKWSKGPEVEDIDQILPGSDGRFAYRASGRKGQRVDQYADHVIEEGKWFAAVEQLRVRADGTPAYVARRDDGHECVVIDTNQSPAVGTIEGFDLGTDEMTTVWVVRSEGRPHVFLDGTAIEINAEPIGDWLWSAGGQHLIYRARHVNVATSVEVEVLVIANRDAPARPITVVGDAVSVPRIADDGKTVKVVVVRNGEPRAIDVPLE